MKLILGLFCLVFGQAMLADSVTCTGPYGEPTPCSYSPLSIYEKLPFESISGNTIAISDTYIEISNPGHFQTPHGNGVSATVNVNDTFALPGSPAGDVLKISGLFAEGTSALNLCCASTSLVLQFRPGDASSPAITLDPFKDVPIYCYKPAACRIDTTVSADAFSTFNIQGLAYLFGNANTASNFATFDALGFTITRFKADGVTPDPFATAPEPASWSLLLPGMGFLLYRFRRKACRE